MHSADSAQVGSAKKIDLSNRPQRMVLIMDEVDGMSAGDRGGVGALNQLIKKSKVPIIAICNDAKSPKMKPLIATTMHLQFRKCAAASQGGMLLGVDERAQTGCEHDQVSHDVDLLQVRCLVASISCTR